MTDVRGGFINTKYSSLKLILDLLYTENIEEQFQNQRRWKWNLANDRTNFRDTMIINMVNNFFDYYEDDVEVNVYYKMITSDIAGKNIQLEYDEIFFCVIDNEDYDEMCPVVEALDCGVHSTLFIFLGLNFFKPAANIDTEIYKSISMYKILRSLLPLNSSSPYSIYFYKIDMMLPFVLASPKEYKYYLLEEEPDTNDDYYENYRCEEKIFDAVGGLLTRQTNINVCRLDIIRQLILLSNEMNKLDLSVYDRAEFDVMKIEDAIHISKKKEN